MKTPEQIAADVLASVDTETYFRRNLTEWMTAAIQADRAQWFDTTSSASVQHYIDTGRYLLHDEERYDA